MLARLRDRDYKRALHARLSGTRPFIAMPPGGRTQQVFNRALFAVMGKLAKLDGRVSEEEVQFASETMQTLALDGTRQQEAIDYFYAGKQENFDVLPWVEALRPCIGGGSTLARQFLKLQCRLAFSKGVIRLREKILLRDVAELLGFDKAELLRLYTEIQVLDAPQKRGPGSLLGEAYSLLELRPGADKREIRRAYHRLMARYHPDKHAHNNQDEAAQREAQAKCQAIREAYDAITGFRKMAGFS